jgi:two-component system, chemotaxis family, sensor kinase Cph1
MIIALRQEIEELKARLAEAEETLRALRTGEVDAIVIYGPAGPSVYTLRGAEHAYRIIVETMTEGAVTTSLDGTVLYGNPSLTRILKTPGGYIMGRPLAASVAPDERQNFAEFLEQARSEPVRGRFSIVAGGRNAAYFSTALLREEGEEPRICMVVTDLTDLEAATNKLRAAQAEKEILQGSEARFRLLAEVIPQIVWTAGPDGRRDYHNRKWSEFSGIPQEEGLDRGWSTAVHPDDLEKTMAAWQRAVAEGTPYEMEHRLRRADGAYRWHLSRALPLLEQGRVLRWFGTATDITDLRDVQRTLEKTVDELGRSNRDLEQFAYIASHDLQTPLRTVSNFVELLARRYQGKLGPEADEYISYAVNGATRMHHLIDDIREYSRINTRAKALAPTDCRAVLDQALAELRENIKESGARITSEDLPTVPANETLFLQLFVNLLSNAIKYRKKEEPPRIHISAEQRDTEWLFSIRDNGIGFEQHYADRIFRVFQRLHTEVEYPGTGIGLAICKKIVERHGGRIWVKSTPGQGSVFYFTIPCAEEKQ